MVHCHLAHVCVAPQSVLWRKEGWGLSQVLWIYRWTMKSFLHRDMDSSSYSGEHTDFTIPRNPHIISVSQACLTSGHLGHLYHYLHPPTFKGFGAAFVPFSPLNTQQFLEWRLVTAFTFREFLSASPKWPDDRLGWSYTHPGCPVWVAWPERKRLGCRDRPFCFSASSMGENPVFSVGLLQWAKWWRQVPLSPNEDRKMGMVERKFIDD